MPTPKTGQVFTKQDCLHALDMLGVALLLVQAAIERHDPVDATRRLENAMQEEAVDLEEKLLRMEKKP